MFDKILDHLNTMSNLRQKEKTASSQNTFHNIEYKLDEMNCKLDILIDLLKVLIEQNNNRVVISNNNSILNQSIKDEPYKNSSFIPSINLEGKVSKTNMVSSSTDKDLTSNVSALKQLTGDK